MPNVVLLAMVPPSTMTGPPQVSPTPMALPALPPLLTSAIETAPPLADDVATPPLPAEAMSPAPESPPPKNLPWRSPRRDWAAAPATPTRLVAAAAAAALTCRFTFSLPPLASRTRRFALSPASAPISMSTSPHIDRSRIYPIWDYQRMKSIIRAGQPRYGSFLGRTALAKFVRGRW